MHIRHQRAPQGGGALMRNRGGRAVVPMAIENMKVDPISMQAQEAHHCHAVKAAPASEWLAGRGQVPVESVDISFAWR